MIVSLMQKRILLLPLVWGIFGISDVPVLGFNVIAMLIVIGLSLYSLGIWNVDWTNRRTRIEFVAVGVLFGSLMALFYFPIFLFSAVGALVYLLAVNID